MYHGVTMPLATERLYFRSPEVWDATELLTVVASSRADLGRYMGWPRTFFTSADAQSLIQCARHESLSGRSVVWLIVERSSGSLVGLIELYEIRHDRRDAELGYWIRSDRAGRGYATEAVRVLTDHAWNRLGLHKLRADVCVGNHGSARVLEKSGFVLEGTLRQERLVGEMFLDNWRYGLVRT